MRNFVIYKLKCTCTYDHENMGIKYGNWYIHQLGSRFHVTILQHCKCNLNCMVWAYLLDILSLSNILEQYY